MNRHIAVITGGDNSERKISLRSGQATLQALQEAGYRTSLYDFPSDRYKFLESYHTIDGVFIMIHGRGGEDGQIASFLQTLDIPYHCTTPDILALTINKRLTKQVWKEYDVPVADDRLVDLSQEIPGYTGPCVVKALDQGSSVGVVICKSETDFHNSLIQLKEYQLVMIEEYLSGKEITVSIMDDLYGGITVLPTIEIIPPEGIRFDYENKYNGETKKIILTDLDNVLQSQINDIALRAYTSLQMTRYGRIDMILTDRGPVCLEINTIPGFTDQSLFSKAAQRYGLSFTQLVDHLVQLMFTVDKD